MSTWITVLMVVSVVSLVAAALLLPRLLTRLPQDFLTNPQAQSRPVKAWMNAMGLVLIIAGVAMLVLPGQGILTIIAGLALTNFPAKDRLMRKMLRQDAVLRGVNALRKKAGAAPMEAP